MTLAVETSGAGPDLVMLHGWGLHGGFFEPLVPHLEARFRVHRVDLPGHGRSPWVDSGAGGLTAWTDAVRTVVPANAAWLGWSLGGLIAMDAALRFPAAVRALVLVASTPRFVTADDWPHAQRPDMLSRFADGLTQDFRKTVSDFLTLQSLGDAHAREQVRALRGILFEHGDPHPDGLAEGLRILRDTDLRPRLGEARMPALCIAGRRDRLTPPEATRAIASAWPRARFEEQAGAAHAPFLSDPAGFARRVVEFAHAH